MVLSDFISFISWVLCTTLIRYSPSSDLVRYIQILVIETASLEIVELRVPPFHFHQLGVRPTLDDSLVHQLMILSLIFDQVELTPSSTTAI